MTKILVIDDEPEITRMLESELSNYDFHVITTNSGREGLKLLKVYSIDLVITDIIMPDIDGFEVIMALSKMKPRPRVIVITGGSEHISKELVASTSSAFGVDYVLEKPFTIDEFLNAFAQVKSMPELNVV